MKVREGTIITSAGIDASRWAPGVYNISLTSKGKVETITVTKM
jgi:hypothetical protein